MPKRVLPLTARQVETARKPGFYADGNGLYLRVAPGGSRSWVYRFMLNGRRRDMGLGPYPLVTLASARERVAAARLVKLDGTDPLEERRAGALKARVERAKVVTFAEAAQQYVSAHRAGWRGARAVQDWTGTIEAYVLPIFGDLPVAEIDTGLVMQAIQPIWNTKTATATRVRARVEAVLDWCRVRGYRQGENPARWKGHIEALLPRKSKVAPVEHHPAMPYGEVAAFLAELRYVESSAARALEFAILTAARSGEVIGARWDEIDIPNRLWIVPAARMKSGREHRVPLSPPAMAVLEKIAETRYSDWVFSGRQVGQPIGKMAMLLTLQRVSGRDDISVHGFRSSFRDWCAELTQYPSELAEMALAHSINSAVEAAYRRGDMFDRRRKLAEAWGRFCTAPATVVALNASQRAGSRA